MEPSAALPGFFLHFYSDSLPAVGYAAQGAFRHCSPVPQPVTFDCRALRVRSDRAPGGCSAARSAASGTCRHCFPMEKRSCCVRDAWCMDALSGSGRTGCRTRMFCGRGAASGVPSALTAGFCGAVSGENLDEGFFSASFPRCGQRYDSASARKAGRERRICSVFTQ